MSEDRLRTELALADQMARDRDDVILSIGEHLRAALAVIERYENKLYTLASDEGSKR